MKALLLSACLVMGLMFSVGMQGNATAATIVDWPDDLRGAVGVITAVEGTVRIFHQSKRVNLKVGGLVYLGDRIETQRRTKIEIMFLDKSILNVGPKSELMVSEYFYSPSNGISETTVDLLKGLVRNRVRKMDDSDSRYEVRTETVVCGVLGTDYFVESDARGAGQAVCIGGRVGVEMVDSKRKRQISKDRRVKYSGSFLSKPLSVSESLRRKLIALTTPENYTIDKDSLWAEIDSRVKDNPQSRVLRSTKVKGARDFRKKPSTGRFFPGGGE